LSGSAATVYFCKYCGCCWQRWNPEVKGNRYKIHYYKDFPSYGKPKRMCKSCIKGYLKISYERVNKNIPITKYLISKRKRRVSGSVCFYPPYKIS